ncbi:efflux RND transporter periplasmic adaptor subunit [Pedobacter glucosidilyticus]|uniref:efflux RND transporter periplasmic adaptor subunit n=1 Tax=Pedobacter glucosidilyticus TaxID=1122941 RepID=UPI000413E6D7|nr:efflux RND transporter periplasmic adaptor subunit [Pedobacter glucosidilyticus]
MKKLFMLTAIVGIALFSACQNHEHEKAEDTNFTITSPIQKDTSVYKEYVGQVQSASHIELRSQERGYLEKIFVDEGQFVKKGQLMFKIMPLIYEAEVEKAKAEMNFTEIEYRNTKSLRDKNIVSENELALAKAKLNKAKAELSLAQAHLGFTEIRAPFDGIMDRFHTRLGSLIEEGELLTTLSNNSKMWVYFNVPEAEYLDYVKLAKTKDAQKVYLQMANKETFDYPGFVETIEADFNNETGNIAFRATFQNPKGILRHGETGNIMMPVVLKSAIIIPQKATFDVLDKKFVYIVDKNNVLKAKQITVAYELPHIYILESGLSVKDRILAEGLGKVKNNEQIKGEFVPFEKEMAELNHLHAE